jgi:hypothetical protein
MTRRTFAKVWTAIAGAAIVPVLTAGDVAASAASMNDADAGAKAPDPQSPAPAGEGDRLQSELLFDLTLERGPANTVGSVGVNRVVVGVVGGAFEGPKLKGTVVAPSGDWIVARPDGSSLLDMRMLLQTDDGQKIYMTGRGIAYTPQGGALHARVLPMFETGAAKYAWMNNVVAAGVYRPMPGKIAYRIYQIL